MTNKLEKENYLLEQMQIAVKEVSSWPQWKKDAIRIRSNYSMPSQENFDNVIKAKQEKIRELYKDDTVDKLLKDIYLILMKPKIICGDNVTIDYNKRCEILDRIKVLGNDAKWDELISY